MRNDIKIYDLEFDSNTHDIDVVYTDNTGLANTTDFDGVSIQEIVDEVIDNLNALDDAADSFKVAEITVVAQDIVEIEIAGKLEGNEYADATIFVHPA